MGALLALLALGMPRRRSREELTDLLWPEADLAAARDRLSQALVWLRPRLEPAGGAARGSVLLADRRTVGLDPGAVTTDVAEFDAALAEASRAATDPLRRAALERAVSLYGGDLLPGYYEDWALAERRRLRDACVGALRRLAELGEREGDLEGALGYARRAAEADPLDEAAHADLIRLLAASGQAAAALRHFEGVERRLARDLGVAPSPALIAERDRARRRTAVVVAAAESTDAGARTAAPPLPRAPGTLPPLPGVLTPLFGREAEVEDVCRMVRDEGARLVTLTGPGGAGKTRLALAALAALAGEYGGAAAFVPLADLESAAQVPAAVAAALRLPVPPARPPLEAVAEALSSRPFLLALDNLEHLLEGAAPLVRELLSRAPMLTLLVTSRQRLGLEGERERPVPPLPLPDAAADLAAVQASPSVRLFADRARAVRPDFAVTEANAATVAAVCARLDGIPLAIELCAAWAQTLTPAQMLEKLGRRFDLLVSRRADIPARHRTLRAALEYSYLLLPAELQRLFTWLSGFRGGWTLEAAAAVAGDGGDALAILPGLTELRERSLVVADEVADGGEAEMRYRMLETLREFAGELLIYADRAALRRAHAGYFMERAEEAEAGMNGPEQDRWLARLDRERENLRAALGWAVEARAPELGLRLGAALAGYWSVRGPLGEARDWLSRLLALEETETLPETVRARACSALGYLAWFGGDYEEAGAAHREALALRRAVGDTAGIAESLYHLGITAYRRSDNGAARALLEESLSIARELGDRAGVARALLNLGNIAAEYGAPGEARALYSESLALEKELGNRRRMANALNNLGLLAQGDRDYEKAAALFEEALALRRELTDHYNAATELANLGTVARLLGQRERARALLTEGLQRAHDFGDRYNTLHYLLQLGILDATEGSAERSTFLISAARHLFEEVTHSQRITEAVGYEEALEANRAALGEAAFAAAWAAGQVAPPGEVVARALLAAPEPPPVPESR